MAATYQYKTFISYSHADEKWARWLQSALEHYRPPRALRRDFPEADFSLKPVFRDREELASSPHLSASLSTALEGSQNLIVICSPAASRSHWVGTEITTFLELGRRDSIFLLIVDGDPSGLDPETDCFPPVLRKLMASPHADSRPLYEPIAADARKEADGKALSKLKLVAGILDLKLSDLRQREQQRKLRFMLVVTLGSVAGLIVALTLATTAYIAREEAQQQREIANIRRSQAEGLLGFMVGDMRDSLEPLGRLDLLEQVSLEAMAYFAQMKTAELSNEELLRHAEILTQLGKIRMSQRQYEAALTAFMEAYERSAELSRNSATNGDHLFGRGQAEFWVGYVHWRRADFDKARKWLTQYRRTSQQLFEFAPGRNDWAREVAYGDHNLAVLELESGDLDAASIGFNKELRALLDLQARDSGMDLRRDIADIYSWLGNISRQKGLLLEASQYYRREVTEFENLVQEEPDNAPLRYSWAQAIQWSADIAILMGDYYRAESLINKVILAFDELVTLDRTNKEWQRAIARSWILKGSILVVDRDLESAQNYMGKSIAVLNKMVNDEASDLIAREQLADAHHLLTWIEFLGHDITGASEANDLALGHIQRVGSIEQLNDDRLGKMASVIVMRGRLYQARGQQDLASQSWRQAEKLLHERASTGESPLLLDPWVRVLILSGQQEEADSVSGGLSVNEYQPLLPWPTLAD